MYECIQTPLSIVMWYRVVCFFTVCSESAGHYCSSPRQPPKFLTQAFATTSRRGWTSSVEDSARATCRMTWAGRTRPFGRRPTATVTSRRRHSAALRPSPRIRRSAGRWRRRLRPDSAGSADRPTTRGRPRTATAAKYCLLLTNRTSTGQYRARCCSLVG